MPQEAVIHEVAHELMEHALEAVDPRQVRRRSLDLLQKVTPFESAIFLCGPKLSGPPEWVNKDRAALFHARYMERREHYLAELAPCRAATEAQGGVYRDTAVLSAAERGKLA